MTWVSHENDIIDMPKFIFDIVHICDMFEALKENVPPRSL
jgi:hypothetical protein